eukprot:SM000034S12775  [mRNA]  locus=s34:750776:753593:+ [translate_table: standard]
MPAASGGGGGGGGGVVVVDSGGGTCRVGRAGDETPLSLPSLVARPRSARRALVGDELDACGDVSGLAIRRPCDRGYVVSWDVQRAVWGRAFAAAGVAPSDAALLLTEPPFTLPAIAAATDEVVFEELGFRACCAAPAAALSHLCQAIAEPGSVLAEARCGVVVDAGFSFTHVTPLVSGRVVPAAVRRIDLGGKGLTNHLVELVSYRSLDVRGEAYILEDVKHRLCFCSLNVARDLEIARKTGPDNHMRADYVLPDGIRHKRGFVRDPAAAEAAKRVSSLGSTARDFELRAATGGAHSASSGSARRQDDSSTKTGATAGRSVADDEQTTIALTNERFLVPEMLFHPADLGINQAGLAECIVHAVKACPVDMHSLLYSSILLTGGSTLFHGFREKLEMELRPIVPDEYALNVILPDRPELCAWRGGATFASSPQFEQKVVTKQEYAEHGSSLCRRRFAF